MSTHFSFRCSASVFTACRTLEYPILHTLQFFLSREAILCVESPGTNEPAP